MGDKRLVARSNMDLLSVVFPLLPDRAMGTLGQKMNDEPGSLQQNK
jgi:hypothetical protein